jgi:hypothetical protein
MMGMDLDNRCKLEEIRRNLLPMSNLAANMERAARIIRETSDLVNELSRLTVIDANKDDHIRAEVEAAIRAEQSEAVKRLVEAAEKQMKYETGCESHNRNECILTGECSWNLVCAAAAALKGV